MIERLKGKENLIKFALLLTALFGIYLMVAWASYSPLDNAWSVASSVTHNVINKTGGIGAWAIDLLFAMFGSVAFLVPFALTLVPSYLLLSKTAETLEWRHFLLWAVSFGVLMIGLGAICTVLLSHSAYYLAGGFIGAMFHDWIAQYFGQFGVLLFAVFFIGVGFYFCSGQVLLELVSRLYDWITENRDEPKTEPQQGVTSEPKSAKLAETADLAEDATEMSASSQAERESPLHSSPLTDLSQFSRPKITGLKTDTASEVPTPSDAVMHSEKPAMTDPSMFKVESHLPLPKVSVDIQSPPQPTAIEPEMDPVSEPSPAPQSNLHFPTVRLNPQTAQAEIEPEPAEDLQIFPEKSPLVEAKSEPEVSLKTEPKPDFVAKMQQGESVPEPKKAAERATEWQADVEKPSYPKSYGDSLIHPLLQPKTKLEKPTTPLPTLDLFEQHPPTAQQITEPEIRETSRRIEQELSNFGIKATVEDVLVGPVVTRYEIQPAAGIKASKISNLSGDLARSLIFEAIRITDKVPGKPYMGIETPNSQRETVWLRDVLASDAFRHSKAILPMALGKSISGEAVVVDMAKMPHLLVAGQTGGGKSVGVNTMILSLLFKFSPEQLRFIMIDPKFVELTIYNDIPHLLTPVITDSKKAENALRWAVEEMERRYQLVSRLSVRNIESYNDKIRQAEEMGLPIPNPLWRPGDTMDALPPPLERMSYMVLIVDEFADLMTTAGKQVEEHIMRIAQKARAVGIHLILATQRPSTDVITGVIKANIPSRIAFTVASQIDSRTILDQTGAESLLGRGDMLYSGAGNPDVIRVHGAFMTDADVQRVADNWRARGKPAYIDSIVESAADDNESNEKASGGDLDPMFDEVVQYMIDSNVTSISGLQRRFSIGFNRAARIVDQAEDQGILSSPDSRGKREVLAR